MMVCLFVWFGGGELICRIFWFMLLEMVCVLMQCRFMLVDQVCLFQFFEKLVCMKLFVVFFCVELLVFGISLILKLLLCLVRQLCVVVGLLVLLIMVFVSRQDCSVVVLKVGKGELNMFEFMKLVEFVVVENMFCGMGMLVYSFYRFGVVQMEWVFL